MARAIGPPRGGVWKRVASGVAATGLPRLQETAPPEDPTVGLCLGSWGGPKGVGELPPYGMVCDIGPPRDGWARGVSN